MIPEIEVILYINLLLYIHLSIKNLNYLHFLIKLIDNDVF